MGNIFPRVEHLTTSYEVVSFEVCFSTYLILFRRLIPLLKSDLDEKIIKIVIRVMEEIPITIGAISKDHIPMIETMIAPTAL